jgi:hypothetical protein
VPGREGNDPVGTDVAGGDPVDAEVAAFAVVDGPFGVSLRAHRNRPSRNGQGRLGQRDIASHVRHIDRSSRGQPELRDGGVRVDAGSDQVSGRPAGQVMGTSGDRGAHLAGGAEELRVGAGGRVDWL